MAQSLSAECTPLKQAYDACFNTWFEGYLEPAIAHSQNVPQAQRSMYAKQKAEEFEQKCGAVWTQYKACVQKAVRERGLGDLLEQARQENPLREPASASEGNGSKRLHASLDNANLYVLNARAQLKSYRFDGLEDLPNGEDALSDPAVVASDVSAQTSFLRQLKFQYLEQKAKDKYVKTIVSDEAPLVTASSNEELRLRNEEKKRALKEAKAKLAERQEDVRTLAPLVEEDYQKARSLTNLATTLSAQILDARLALTRLRQAHPHPRLTIASATSTLDAQVKQMQNTEAELQELNSRISKSKEQVKDEIGELEQLRSIEKERLAELELMGKEAGEEEDPRVGGLYDWFMSSLSIHRSLLSLKSTHIESENELRLTYSIDPPPSSTSQESNELVLTLLFIPNTRQLVSADVTLGGNELELGDVIDALVQANDISGLVWAVLSRARAIDSDEKMDVSSTNLL